MGKNGKSDEELTDLLTKLYTIQEDIGAKPKSSDDEKKAKAENISAMGKGKKAAEKGSKFLALKGKIIDHLKEIHDGLKAIKEKESDGFGGDNHKAVIKMQNENREKVRQAGDDWKELDQMYRKEAKKKRSKFTPEELEVQADLVLRLNQEIEKVKATSMKGYSRVGAQGNTMGGINPVFMNEAGKAGGGGGNWKPGGGTAVTAGQQQMIMQIEERDREFDAQLDQIAEGIQDLQDIANLQGEEVAHQTQMLDQLHGKMDNANERVVNVNERMKETLEEVGRSSDKMCVDIMCIVLMIGFGTMMYNYVKEG